jgi:hypothetical protein
LLGIPSKTLDKSSLMLTIVSNELLEEEDT